MQQDYQISVPNYRAINVLLRYGQALSVAVGVIVLLAGVWLAVYFGNIVFGIGGVFAASFAYLIMRSYVELVTVIADMLLPK